MKNLIKDYTNQAEERINYGLMNKDYDDSLVLYIANACKSLEILEYITFDGYEYIEDESKIDINNYIPPKRSKTKKVDPNKYRYINDSRYGEMILRFIIRLKGQESIIRKRILIPVADEDGFYLIKGTKYFLMYQLVDSSTYNTADSLTLKSLMAVVLTINSREFKDIDGETYEAPIYRIKTAQNNMRIMLYYFAKMGAEKTLQFFSVNYIVDFVNKPEDKEKNIYFQINSKLFLEVNRSFFMRYQYVRSIIFMILDISSNRLSIEKINDRFYWIEKLGASNNTKKYNFYEKGLSVLTYFDRLIDETTRKVIRIHPQHKENIYTILRWMIQNYNELRKKDNLDLANKRLRCNEYIASLLTRAFSERISRIIGYGRKVTIEQINDIFKFNGDIIIKQLHKSGLLRYDDNVNDMDMFSKLKFTIKGPNSLGNKSENTISVPYRGIHPSFIGRVDINVCGIEESIHHLLDVLILTFVVTQTLSHWGNVYKGH